MHYSCTTVQHYRLSIPFNSTRPWLAMNFISLLAMCPLSTNTFWNQFLLTLLQFKHFLKSLVPKMAQSPRAACGASSRAFIGHARPKSAKQMRSLTVQLQNHAATWDTVLSFRRNRLKAGRWRTSRHGAKRLWMNASTASSTELRFFKAFKNDHSKIQQASIATNLASVRREKNMKNWLENLFWLCYMVPLLWTKSRALPIEEITWGACKTKVSCLNCFTSTQTLCR